MVQDLADEVDVCNTDHIHVEAENGQQIEDGVYMKNISYTRPVRNKREAYVQT